MTVLCQSRQRNETKQRLRRFATKGRYSWPYLLISFYGWKVNLPDILAKTEKLQTGRDLCYLIKDILLANPNKAKMIDHPDAPAVIGAFLEDATSAFDNHLKQVDDRDIAIIEYLADGLEYLEQRLAT